MVYLVNPGVSKNGNPYAWAQTQSGFISWLAVLVNNTKVFLPGTTFTPDWKVYNDVNFYTLEGKPSNTTILNDITSRLMHNSLNGGLPQREDGTTRVPLAKIQEVSTKPNSKGTYGGFVKLKFKDSHYIVSVKFPIFTKQDGSLSTAAPKIMRFQHQEMLGRDEDRDIIRYSDVTGDVLGAVLQIWAEEAKREIKLERRPHQWRVCATCRWHQREIWPQRRSSYEMRDDGEIKPRHRCSFPGQEHIIGAESVRLANDSLSHYSRRAKAWSTIWLTPHRRGVPGDMQEQDIWVESCKNHAFTGEPCMENVEVSNDAIRVFIGTSVLKILRS